MKRIGPDLVKLYDLAHGAGDEAAFEAAHALEGEIQALRARVAELEAMEQRALGMLEGLPTLMSDHQAAREILGR